MDGLTKYLPYKIIGTITLYIPNCFLNFTTSSREITFAIIVMVFIDTVLVIAVSLKNRIFSSHHLSRVFSKVGTYGIALLLAWILSAVEPVLFGWFFRFLGLFILITELFSNFEKLSLLGMKTPTVILARLNKQFLKLMYADNEEDKAIISEDILKNRNVKINFLPYLDSSFKHNKIGLGEKVKKCKH